MTEKKNNGTAPAEAPRKKKDGVFGQYFRKNRSTNTAAEIAAELERVMREEAPAAEEAPAEIAHKETLVIGTAEDINNLNLQTQKTANNNIILKTTHQTLVFFNNDPEAETRFDPGLATDWEFEDDYWIYGG